MFLYRLKLISAKYRVKADQLSRICTVSPMRFLFDSFKPMQIGPKKICSCDVVPRSNLVPVFLQFAQLPNPKDNHEREIRGKKLTYPNNDGNHSSKQRSLPQLMPFSEILWPSTILALINWISIQFIIRPYFDNEFYIRDFIVGAKRALQVVSSNLANGEFEALENLLSSEVLTEIKPIIQKLSVSQRQQLEVRENDIYLSFPYQIGIIFDDTNEKPQRRWVEITMVFHSLNGLSEMKERGEAIPWNMGTMSEYQEKVHVCNYRFIKEFTNENHSDWTVNAVNHFKPIDLIKKQ